MDFTPEDLHRLSQLLEEPVLDRTGFHLIYHWLLKDVHELGYLSVSDFVTDYELAIYLDDNDLLTGRCPN